MSFNVSCTVNVSVEELSVNSLEKAALDGAREAGRRLLESLLAVVEMRVREGRRCACGGRLESRGRVERKLMSLVGEIKFSRQKLQCMSCGGEVVPLDEAIGLRPRSRVTVGVREKALWLATEMAYEGASLGLKKVAGIEVSAETIKHLVEEEGGEVVEEMEEERRRVWEEGEAGAGGEGKRRVFVEVDGTGINDRARRGWFEAKVGVIFSEVREVSKDRVEIMDKRTYATMEGVGAFGENFVIEAHKYGVFNSQEVIFVSDGASWCHKLREDYFPGSIYVLDFWHLARNIRVSLGVEHREMAGRLIYLASRGQTEQMRRHLELLCSSSRDPTFRARIAELWGYIESNEEGIKNAARLDFYGSGPIEKAVDVTICRRFKRRGMSWYVRKAYPLLGLRLLKINEEWEKYWRKKGLVTV